MLNINHLARTRSIASLPCKIVLGDWKIWFRFFPRNHFIIRVFSPWNGEWFLSLGQCGRPSLEGGGGIVWLAAWKLDSNDAKRTVAPPNAKHSTPCPKAVFYVFVFDSIHDSTTMLDLSPGFFPLKWLNRCEEIHTKKNRVKFVLICGWYLTTNFTNHTNKNIWWLILCKVPYPLISNLLLLTF